MMPTLSDELKARLRLGDPSLKLYYYQSASPENADHYFLVEVGDRTEPRELWDPHPDRLLIPEVRSLPVPDQHLVFGAFNYTVRMQSLDYYNNLVR